MDLKGKVALITGASEGIGAACAHAFRRRGAQLALTARSAERLREVAGPNGFYVPGDLRDANFRVRLVEETLEAFGRIDVLVNNAGVGLYAPAHTAGMEDARSQWELNFFAALHLIQLAAPKMKERRSGFIVNIGSIAGKITLPWFTLYSASKYALGSLTEGLRIELEPHGVRAMLVCPGYVKTGFQSHALAGRPPELGARSRRWSITAEDCAEALVRGVERNARTVVAPRSGWLLIALTRLFPGITDKVLGKALQKQEGGL